MGAARLSSSALANGIAATCGTTALPKAFSRSIPSGIPSEPRHNLGVPKAGPSRSASNSLRF